MTSNLKLAWDTDSLKWDTNQVRDRFDTEEQYTYIGDMEFGYARPRSHARTNASYQQQAPYYPPQPIVLQQPSAPQYIPMPSQPQYIPMPSQPVVVNNTPVKRSKVGAIIALILFVAFFCVAIYFLLHMQQPLTVDGVADTIDAGLQTISTKVHELCN